LKLNLEITLFKEIVEKELETTRQQQNNIKLEVEQSVVEGEKLQNLHQKRDELLGEKVINKIK
jgi:3-dehydroquinate dehydratase